MKTENCKLRVTNHQKIKKIFWFFVCAVLVLGFCRTPQTQASQEARDQYFIGSGTANDDLEDLGNFPMTQSFVPTMDHLTKVRLEFSGSGSAASWIVSIDDTLGNRLVETKAAIQDGWVTFVFDSPFALTPGQSYKIEIQQSGLADLGLVYNDPGEYPSGNAETGVAVPTKDYHFETYGYNEAQTTPQSSEEAASQSEEISAPTAFKARPGKDKKSVDLSWEASKTENISGYRIYRSESSGENYKKIANLGAESLKYSDRNLKQNKKYYYIVRAHIDSLESENSEEVSIILEEEKKVEEQNNRAVLIYWLILAGAVVVMLVGYLIWAKRRQRWPFRGEQSEIVEI